MSDTSPPENNPFAPPTSEPASIPIDGKYQLAGTGKRFATFLADRILMMLVVFCIAMLIELGGPETLSEIEEGYPTYYGRLEERIFDYLAGLLLTVVYYAIFEATTGRSPAKWIFGTMVLNNQQGRASFGQILGRSFARVIPFEPFSAFRSNGLMWHDSLSNTITVDLRKPKLVTRRATLSLPTHINRPQVRPAPGGPRPGSPPSSVNQPQP